MVWVGGTEDGDSGQDRGGQVGDTAIVADVGSGAAQKGGDLIEVAMGQHRVIFAQQTQHVRASFFFGGAQQKNGRLSCLVNFFGKLEKILDRPAFLLSATAGMQENNRFI